MNWPYISLYGFVLFAVIVIGYSKPLAGYGVLLILKPIFDRFYSDVVPSTVTTYVAPSSFSFLQVFAVCSIIYMGSIVVARKMKFFFSPQVVLFFAFICLSVASYFISGFYAGYVEILGSYVAFLLAWIYAYNSLTCAEDLRKISKTVAVSVMFPAFSIAYSYFTGAITSIGNVDRYMGGYFHMSIVACVLYTAVPAIFYLLSNRENITQFFLYSIYLALLFIAIYLTGYRTAIYGVAIFFIVYMILKKKIHYIVPITICALLVVLAYGKIFERYEEGLAAYDHIDAIFSNNNKFDYLLSGRFGIWRGTLFQLLDTGQEVSFLFGGGDVLKKVTGLHSSIFDILLYHGIIPLVFFMIWYSSLISRAFAVKTKDNYKEIVLAFMVAALIISFTRGYFFDFRNSIYIALYLGILFKLPFLERTKNSIDKSFQRSN